MKRFKALTMGALLLLLVFLLGGCMKMHINIVWQEDNTGNVATVIGVDEAVLASLGLSTDEVLEGIRESLLDEGGFVVEDYRDEMYVGVAASMDIDDLTAFPTAATEELSFTCTEADGKKVYTFAGEYDGSDLADLSDGLESETYSISDLDMQLSIVMPGEIIDHNADQRVGNKLIWDIATYAKLPVLAISEVYGQAPAPAAEEIKVLLDGVYLSFDQPPIIEEGRTLVPLRVIFEALGASVEWDPETQTVTAVKDDLTISLQIGSAILSKNGEAIILDVPAQIVGGRTLVPARAVAESFGAFVDWENDTRTVIILTS